MAAQNFPITVYHNPECGTSRNALAMIRAAGYSPAVVEYLTTGWDRQNLSRLLEAMEATPRDVLREKGTPAEALGLLDGAATADQIFEAMIANPVLVNRPIVETPLGVLLCRPSEVVLGLLDRQPEEFVKEDGEAVPKRG